MFAWNTTSDEHIEHIYVASCALSSNEHSAYNGRKTRSQLYKQLSNFRDEQKKKTDWEYVYATECSGTK